MSAGLAQLGYDLEPSEVAILMQQLDLNADGQVGWGQGWAGRRAASSCCLLAAAAAVGLTRAGGMMGAAGHPSVAPWCSLQGGLAATLRMHGRPAAWSPVGDACAVLATQVHAPEFVASQMDWAALQESNRCAAQGGAGTGQEAGEAGRLRARSLPLIPPHCRAALCAPHFCTLPLTLPLTLMQGPVARVRPPRVCGAGRRQRRAADRGEPDWHAARQAAGRRGGLRGGGCPGGGGLRGWVGGWAGCAGGCVGHRRGLLAAACCPTPNSSPSLPTPTIRSPRRGRGGL